jgi:hypothetical protein
METAIVVGNFRVGDEFSLVYDLPFALAWLTK